MSIRSNLNKEAYIKLKGTKSSDSMGGYTLGDDVTVDKVDCRISQLRGQEAEIYNRESNKKVYRVYMEPVDVLVGTNFLLIDNTEYEILDVNNIDGMDRLMQVDVEVVKK